MRILAAEDDAVSRHLLVATLRRAGHEVEPVVNGTEALAALQAGDGPRLAVLDWMMPGLDGPQVCQQLRDSEGTDYHYLILLTARNESRDVVDGLESGADDYLAKPCQPDELLSRIRAGERILRLETTLASRVHELEDALAHVRTLQGLLPICMHCKMIRDDQDTWHRIESYIQARSDAEFTHSLCGDCLKVHYPHRSRS